MKSVLALMSCLLKGASMATLQVRNIEDRLYKALAARAAQNNRSISQEVVTILQDHLAQPALSHEEATRRLLALGRVGELRQLLLFLRLALIR